MVPETLPEQLKNLCRMPKIPVDDHVLKQRVIDGLEENNPGKIIAALILLYPEHTFTLGQR